MLTLVIFALGKAASARRAPNGSSMAAEVAAKGRKKVRRFQLRRDSCTRDSSCKALPKPEVTENAKPADHTERKVGHKKKSEKRGGVASCQWLVAGEDE